MLYKCHFKIFDHARHIIFDGSITNITNGFWLNEEGKFTRGDDAKYFIPASRLIAIEKITE